MFYWEWHFKKHCATNTFINQGNGVMVQNSLSEKAGNMWKCACVCLQVQYVHDCVWTCAASSHPSGMKKFWLHVLPECFSLFLQGDGFWSGPMRFHETGNGDLHELLYNNSQPVSPLSRSDSCAAHHCRAELCTEAKEKEKYKFFDANLKHNWELQ